MKTAKLFLVSAVCASMLLSGCSKNGGNDEPKTYTVTVTNGDNGEAEADKPSATEGETVKLTATAAPGCEFVKWTVESGGVTCSPGESANPATFTMPAADVKIKAEFSKGILINGVVWAPCNVDAPGTFAANPEDYGMYYQWNRRIGWTESIPPISSEGGTTWDATLPEGESWAAANDPCPEGWRVPTQEEHSALASDKTTTNWAPLNGVVGRTFTDKESGNSIFLPSAGNLSKTGGVTGSAGINGYIWSATLRSSGYAYLLESMASGVYQSGFNLIVAVSVRCVAK